MKADGAGVIEPFPDAANAHELELAARRTKIRLPRPILTGSSSFPACVFQLQSYAARETLRITKPDDPLCRKPDFYRLLRILKVSLTVNLRNQNGEIFLPSDLPSKMFA
jgi:hypothetical protein